MRDESFLIFSEDPPTSYSPAGLRARYLALACNSISRNVAVLTLHGKQSKDKHSKKSHSSALLYTVNFSRGMPYPLSALFDPVKLLFFLVYGAVLCRRHKVSHIVALMPPVETGIGGLVFATLLRKKLVIDYMDDWESSLSSELKRYIPLKLMVPVFKLSSIVYSSSNLLFVITHTLANRIRRRGINASVILVPNGADTLIFFPRNEKSRKETRMKRSLPLSKIVIAYCGSGTNTYYRLDLILSAAKSLPETAKQKIFFVFYLYSGIEYYRRLKKTLNISDDLVEIREPLPRKILSEVMAACDVGLVPFDEEPYLLYAMSTKVYEYLSEGLYVIGSGPREGELNLFFSRNINCGAFVRPRVEDFVSAFLSTIKNTDGLFEDNARKCRYSFMKENHDLREIMVKAMAKVLNSEDGSK